MAAASSTSIITAAATSQKSILIRDPFEFLENDELFTDMNPKDIHSDMKIVSDKTKTVLKVLGIVVLIGSIVTGITAGIGNGNVFQGFEAFGKDICHHWEIYIGTVASMLVCGILGFKLYKKGYSSKISELPPEELPKMPISRDATFMEGEVEETEASHNYNAQLWDFLFTGKHPESIGQILLETQFDKAIKQRRARLAKEKAEYAAEQQEAVQQEALVKLKLLKQKQSKLKAASILGISV